MQKHYDPRPSVIVQRYQFNTRNQLTGEAIASCIAELRHLAEHCKFGTTLNAMLRDRLVCGVEEPRIQRKLLAEPDLFDKAFKLTSAAEAADKNVKDLQSTKSLAMSVNRLNHCQQKICSCCAENHRVADCHFKISECYKCGKKGHLARVCRSKIPSKKESHPQRKSNPCSTTHVLTEDSEDYSMYNVTGSPVQPLKVTVIANSANLEMEVDTAASTSIISEQTYNQLWSQDRRPTLQPTAVKLRTYSGEQLNIKSVIKVKVQYNGQSESLPLTTSTRQRLAH